MPSSVADQCCGSGIRCGGAFFTPYPGWVESGSGMNSPDHIFGSLETIFLVKIPKFFDADPGWKKFGSEIRNTVKSGYKINILNAGQRLLPRDHLGAVAGRLLPQECQHDDQVCQAYPIQTGNREIQELIYHILL